MRRIGLVVNPIAGMGGRVGLKGTDGMVERARELGAEPRAPDRAVRALESLRNRASEITVVTWGSPMGEDEATAAGFEPTILGRPDGDRTTAADTHRAVEAFVAEDVDLILFVGGDGTAVDVATTLDDGGGTIPILGVPAGVKVFSSVFAVSPEAAGRLAATFEDWERREVNDIDEEAYRAGTVRAAPKGVARVPVDGELQSSKQVMGGDVESLARGVADAVEPGVTYVLGPGGTLQTVKDALGFEGSPLGVDVYRNGAVVVRDANEAEILDELGPENVIVVSPIGGQGFVFGRGNDQLSPAVIRDCDLEIVASREKLESTGVLRVDTGDESLDDALRGWVRVRTGRFEQRMIKIV
ncbi:putative inorganic polyphosphate/ATP-NAD kinase [Halanaeroarchaeum sp. HSR-CO]|uniref:ATP-NAD kinase family protein n=1 Tax=Halanaeroarchaeum sp. HSR-CO TaxID=2866382 RepID=UPI00217E3133|nr:ATP-NAD kinase family protein [Halanaeroarchaeum sp. HSR-CO]UWG47681.1 putative inorganic polyphosphate/ATP-NAD kinase [Halanaeroarchaeum sp. HSR-CO]